MLVNGGGAVTLQFQRSPFRPLTRTVFVPWNQVSNYAAGCLGGMSSWSAGRMIVAIQFAPENVLY